MRRYVAVLVSVLMLLSACTSSTPAPTTPADLPSTDPVVAALVAGLKKFDVSAVPVVGAAADAQSDLKAVTSGLGDLRPDVTSETGVFDPQSQTSTVQLNYRFAVGEGWSYTAKAVLALVGGEWRVNWATTILHPELSAATRLRYQRSQPLRAAINGSDGLALVEATPVVRVGLDKANLDKSKWDAAARQLAAALSMDADAYAKKVAASGAQAFVVAKTVRQDSVPPAAANVPGIYLQDAREVLAIRDGFAPGVLGVTGEATAEIVDASKGAVKAGDVVGLTGLQRRHDEQLRGVVGHKIELVARPASATKSSSSPSASAVPVQQKVLFEQAPVPGKPLNLTLNAELQLKAEAVLKDQPVVASFVALKVSTGELLAAANSPTSGANPFATTGRYPPGSTFKIITSLALLRKGLTANSSVSCTPTYTVSGRSFPNYDNYPSSGLGTVPLAKAFSMSCNTAFMQAGEQLSVDEVASAAASLGLGIDYNPGFASFYGSVPKVDNAIAKAAGMIGQGQVEASPMSMAGVVASVASGKTVIPWMVKGTQPESKAQPLTASESATLRSMMGGVVNGGTAKSLAGIVDGAKTGTAQFGASEPYKKHAWVVAWHGDIAVAAFVYDGVSGATSAAPLVKAFFS